LEPAGPDANGEDMSAEASLSFLDAITGNLSLDDKFDVEVEEV